MRRSPPWRRRGPSQRVGYREPGSDRACRYDMRSVLVVALLAISCAPSQNDLGGYVNGICEPTTSVTHGKSRQRRASLVWSARPRSRRTLRRPWLSSGEAAVLGPRLLSLPTGSIPHLRAHGSAGRRDTDPL